MQKLIRNAIVYRAELPDAAHTANHLAERPYQEIKDIEISRSSFIENTVTNELVSAFPGGFAFTLRHDEKILPNASVKAVAKRRIDAICQLHGLKRLPAATRKQIEDDTRIELAKTALVKTTTINAFYHADTKTLIVATGSKKLASLMVGLLVHHIGSVKTTTIHISDIKNGLTTRLRAHLEGGEEAFQAEGFDLLGKVKLVASKDSVTYSLGELDQSRQGIIDLIDTGFTVDRLGLVHSDVAFTLTNDFHFKSISIDLEEEEQDEASDAAHEWRVAAGTQAALMTGVVDSLCDLLGYKSDDQSE